MCVCVYVCVCVVRMDIDGCVVWCVDGIEDGYSSLSLLSLLIVLSRSPCPQYSHITLLSLSISFPLSLSALHPFPIQQPIQTAAASRLYQPQVVRRMSLTPVRRVDQLLHALAVGMFRHNEY
jgi:hypothetical protein